MNTKFTKVKGYFLEINNEDYFLYHKDHFFDIQKDRIKYMPTKYFSLSRGAEGGSVMCGLAIPVKAPPFFVEIAARQITTKLLDDNFGKILSPEILEREAEKIEALVAKLLKETEGWQ